MSGDKAQLTLLVENVIYNQETHTNKGEAQNASLCICARARISTRASLSCFLLLFLFNFL